MSKVIERDRFQNVSRMIEELCEQYGLPVPKIMDTYIGEPCDFTSTQLIRLFVKNDSELPSYDYHALHVFGHYLCALEQTEFSDKVVDIITENLVYSYK